MVKSKKQKKMKTIQLKQKQVVNIYTHSIRKTQTPLSKGSKPMPQLNNMPTFNPIYRVQPVGTQTIELERRMNDEITNLKKEISTLRELSAEHKNPLNAELNNPLKDKVIPEHSNQIQEAIGISRPPKKKTLSTMNSLELKAEMTQLGHNPDGMTKKQMIDFIKRSLA